MSVRLLSLAWKANPGPDSPKKGRCELPKSYSPSLKCFRGSIEWKFQTPKNIKWSFKIIQSAVIAANQKSSLLFFSQHICCDSRYSRRLLTLMDATRLSNAGQHIAVAVTKRKILAARRTQSFRTLSWRDSASR